MNTTLTTNYNDINSWATNYTGKWEIPENITNTTDNWKNWLNTDVTWTVDTKTPYNPYTKSITTDKTIDGIDSVDREVLESIYDKLMGTSSITSTSVKAYSTEYEEEIEKLKKELQDIKSINTFLENQIIDLTQQVKQLNGICRTLIRELELEN